MSQHIYRTKTKDGKEVDVFAGWDKPMQRFYLVIEEVGSDEDEPFYSNLLDPEVENRNTSESFDYFLEVLNGFGIRVPEEMIKAIERDRIRNAVNEKTTWS